VLVIHAPSDTMAFYAGHPGRKLAQAAPAAQPVAPLERWCGLDPAREGPLPIDDANGGCDGGTSWKKGDPVPWTRQIATLTIADGDAITDSVEAYNLLRQRGIEHLLVAGVHTNMCVLGRPFAIRQMVRQGLDVALVRDLTDAMYDPERPPFVNHHTGTDLVVEHIERHWCPTLRSGDLLDGREYRFPDDDRPTVAILQGEDEYETARTLPTFAREHLGKGYRVALVWLEEPARTRFAGIEAVKDADILFISVRRHPLPPEQIALLKAHVAAGKPVLGIRTASHPFHLRDKPPPAGLADWSDFDATVLGGSYTNHHSRDLATTAWPLAEARDHPILGGVSRPWRPVHDRAPGPRRGRTAPRPGRRRRPGGAGGLDVRPRRRRAILLHVARAPRRLPPAGVRAAADQRLPLAGGEPAAPRRARPPRERTRVALSGGSGPRQAARRCRQRPLAARTAIRRIGRLTSCTTLCIRPPFLSWITLPPTA
jgi:hypothetical protein